MRTNRISFITFCTTVAFTCLCLPPLQGAEEAPSVSAILQKYARASQLSPALEEIIKLSKAGVAEPVTLAYIQTSPTPYSLGAQDIIRLREQGVSSQVVTAMMEHGDKLRRAVAAANPPAQTTEPATATQSPAAPPAAVAYAQSPSYPASSVSVTYIGYPRYNSYPGYYGYGGGCYPTYSYVPQYGYGYCGPRVGFGVGYRGVYAGYSRGYYGGYGRCR